MDLEYSAAGKIFRDDLCRFFRQDLRAVVSAKVSGHKELTREDAILRDFQRASAAVDA